MTTGLLGSSSSLLGNVELAGAPPVTYVAAQGMTLFLAGVPYTYAGIPLFTLGNGIVNNQITLFTWGNSSQSGSITLFTGTQDTSSGKMNLFVQALLPGVFKQTTLFVQGFPQNGFEAGISLYTVAGNKVFGSMNLFCCSPLIDKTVSNMNLVVAGAHLYVANGIPLYLATQSGDSAPYFPLFPILLENNQGNMMMEDFSAPIWMEQPPAEVMSLFISGVAAPTPMAGSMNLVIARDPNNAISLFLCAPLATQNLQASLFIWGNQAQTNNVPLFMPTQGQGTNQMTLFSSGF